MALHLQTDLFLHVGIQKGRTDSENVQFISFSMHKRKPPRAIRVKLVRKHASIWHRIYKHRPAKI